MLVLQASKTRFSKKKSIKIENSLYSLFLLPSVNLPYGMFCFIFLNLCCLQVTVCCIFSIVFAVISRRVKMSSLPSIFSF